MNYDEYSSAYEDLKLALSMTPNDKNIVQLITRIKAEMSKLENAGNNFKGMFNNLKSGLDGNSTPSSRSIFPKTPQEKVQEMIYGNLDSEDKCLDYLLCFEVDPSRSPPEGVLQLEEYYY